jgi:hypothetical protein
MLMMPGITVPGSITRNFATMDAGRWTTIMMAEETSVIYVPCPLTTMSIAMACAAM